MKGKCQSKAEKKTRNLSRKLKKTQSISKVKVKLEERKRIKVEPGEDIEVEETTGLLNKGGISGTQHDRQLELP